MRISVERYLMHNYPSFERWPSFLKGAALSLFRKLFHEREINDVLVNNRHLDAFDFIEYVLDYFNIDITINKNQLLRIPSYGRAVLIANHPLGALDSLALLHVVKEVRSDVKIVASNFLKDFSNIEDIIIPIENVSQKLTRKSVGAIYRALENEEVVIIFPSGEVSRAGIGGIKESKWKKGFLKIAQNTRSPILPVYIDAKNSKTFYFLSMINSSLATAAIPGEMFKYYNKNISFHIGRSIPYESYYVPNINIESRVKLMRKHFYRIAKKQKEIFKTYNEIALAQDRGELKRELDASRLIGSTPDGKKIYLYASANESAIIKEIGRLREISFRQVKEGSRKKRDIDDFDYCYEHIVLWDDKDLEIVGSYRIVKADEMVDAYGADGLYTSTLFEYKDGFEKYLSNSIELGRSFVQPKYWNSRALDYLWQGIGAYIRINPDIRYLFGCVSISGSYPQEAIDMLVYFYTNYFGAKERSVRHKESYILGEAKKIKYDELFFKNDYAKDLVILKHQLGLIGHSVPTLYKQYSELCEEGGVEFIDFGMDKGFENCVDGFLVVDLDKLKPQKRKRYIGN